jgi:large subunit ribosomal protein L34
MGKPTWNPNKRKRLRTHGFRQRMLKAVKVLSSRRLKGRKRLTVSEGPVKKKYA